MYEIKYVCMITSPNVPEKLKLLRFLEIDIFFNENIALYYGVTQGDNSEVQNAVFSKRKT